MVAPSTRSTMETTSVTARVTWSPPMRFVAYKGADKRAINIHRVRMTFGGNDVTPFCGTKKGSSYHH